MKILVATDAHIYKTPDGKYWSKVIYGYNFWTRYLQVFNSVRIVARVKTIKNIDDGLEIVSGPGVEVYPIPFFQGPKQLLQKYISIQKSLKNVSKDCDVALLRLPSQTAQMTLKYLNKQMPIAGEIVYNPYDDIVRKDKNIINRCINRIIHIQLKKFCKIANGVSYVTKNSIQKHYPSYCRLYGYDKYHFETNYSTITLSKEAFSKPVMRNKSLRKLSLVLTDVAMNSERKGEHTLIKIVKECNSKGYDISAFIIGDGLKRPAFEKMCEELGVKDKIIFTGLLSSSDAVRDIMKKADVFVFPTQGEGLPRAILEAMAIGMPVLSTPVGGIPEVIEKEYLFHSDDVKGFCKKIYHLIENIDEFNRVSSLNYNKALEFRNEILQVRRNEFYNNLKLLAQK